MVCFRCDGKGQYKNEFGIMEKCESCQRNDMTFEKVDAEPDSDEEGYWKMTEKKSKKRAGRMQKGEKLARQKDRVRKYKSEQQKKKRGKKPRKY